MTRLIMDVANVRSFTTLNWIVFSLELACLTIICVRMSRGKSHVAMEIGPGKLTSYLHAYSLPSPSCHAELQILELLIRIQITASWLSPPKCFFHARRLNLKPLKNWLSQSRFWSNNAQWYHLNFLLLQITFPPACRKFFGLESRGDGSVL